MRQLLQKYGIDPEKFGTIWEFPAIEWAWYSGENKTCLEVEIHKSDDGISVALLFVLEAEGVVQRSPMMVVYFDTAWRLKEGLIFRELLEEVGSGLTLAYSEENEAYRIDEEQDAALLTMAILDRHGNVCVPLRPAV